VIQLNATKVRGSQKHQVLKQPPTGHQLVTHWSPTGHPLVFNVVRQMPLALIKALLRSTNTSAPQTLFV